MALEAARSSLWIIPTALILAAVVLAAGTIAIDRVVGEPLADIWWGFRIGVEGTRSTLSTIAASVITVAGVAFSFTMIVFQLASSQYTSRVIRTFRRDRFIQLVIGLNTATFLYALLVLRTIRSSEEGFPFTAPVSVIVALVLGAACILALVAMVHHVARSVQVSSIIASIANETREAIERGYPLADGEPQDEAPDASASIAERDDEPWHVHASGDGYIGFVDASGLAHAKGVELVCVDRCVGAFVRRGEPIARAWPRAASERHADALDGAFALSGDRTIRQDVAYGLRLLADIASRALSPGINDPTTAVQCVDELGALLSELGKRPNPRALVEVDHGTRVYVPRPSRAELVALAFDEIIEAAGGFARVQRAIVDACRALLEAAPRAAATCELPALLARMEHAVDRAGWYARDRSELFTAIHDVRERASSSDAHCA